MSKNHFLFLEKWFYLFHICHFFRQYTRAENGGLMNAQYVDNSYKYAGGGIVSNAKDIAMFGLQMLCSAQNCKGIIIHNK